MFSYICTVEEYPFLNCDALHFVLMYMFLHTLFLCCIIQDILKAQGSSDEPSFCTKGASRFDFGQGSVGKQGSLAYS